MGNRIIQIGEIFALVLILLFSGTAVAQNGWTRRADLPAPGRNHMVMFAIGNYGYALTGGWYANLNSVDYKDFYRYDPAQDAWDSLPDFPGSARNYAVGVEINGKGYVGFGQSGGLPLKDLWEYDPGTSTWVQKASCPCDARFHPAYVALNGKFYVGLGDGWGTELKDWWVYDPGNDTWAQKTDFPGVRRHYPMAFTDGSQAFVGFGHTSTQGWAIYKDLYAYDPGTDSWTQKADLPASPRVAGVGLSMNGKGYIIAGQDSTHVNNLYDFYEYDPGTDSWNVLPDFPVDGRWAPAAFVLNGEIYFGTGQSDTRENNDFWQFSLNPVATTEPAPALDLQVYPTLARSEVEMAFPEDFEGPILVTLRTLTGGTLMEANYPAQAKSARLRLPQLASGTYLVEVRTARQRVSRRLIIQP